eukprot:COSAG06_NODE_1318_length_9880_cov_5.233923_4_plen_98_part_00
MFAYVRALYSFPAEQLQLLESRFAAMHAAKLLSEKELAALEDIVGDFVAEKPAVGVFSIDMVGCNVAAARLQQLAALSETFASDVAFARQAKRRFSL